MLNNAVLGTIQLKGSHTSENIAAEFKATQTKWNFPTPKATTDNAANERKAYEINKWERFGCLGHKINLVVKNSLGVSELGKLLGKARKIFPPIIKHYRPIPGKTKSYFQWTV